jgi:dihydropteroate synthase-like protein
MASWERQRPELGPAPVANAPGSPTCVMPHYLFVTGKLAEPALRRTLADLAPKVGFEYDVAVLPITVVSLATTPWIVRHLQITASFDRIVLPGLCQGDLTVFAGQPVERGPKDFHGLAEYFAVNDTRAGDYGKFDIEILAEINHAPQLSLEQIVAQARKAHADGADIIDLGCDPGGAWEGVGDAVKALRGAGLRVSIDTMNPREAQLGAKAGAELILSVNRTNREAAADWGCEVVVIPDVPANLEGLAETVDHLQKAAVPFRIDPILEPIAFGFAASVGRYMEVRRRYPEIEILMGIGNLTELTDVDSAGVNVLLMGFCQELGIRSVLTTEVINWCRSSVRECDLARRLAFHAVSYQVLPKNQEPGLVMLRDPRLTENGAQALQELSERISDKNFRLFAERGLLQIMNKDVYLQGDDPFQLFEEMSKRAAIDPSHAFYLGYELAKAQTALTLGKNYVQDQALRWGFLTAPAREQEHQKKANEE